jgi:hypothetical protein
MYVYTCGLLSLCSDSDSRRCVAGSRDYRSVVVKRREHSSTDTQCVVRLCSPAGYVAWLVILLALELGSLAYTALTLLW